MQYVKESWEVVFQTSGLERSLTSIEGRGPFNSINILNGKILQDNHGQEIRLTLKEKTDKAPVSGDRTAFVGADLITASIEVD